VLWSCWLGSRKGTWPVKTELWGAGMVICLEQGADLHMAQLMPLPLTVSCFSKIYIGCTFLVPAHLGSPGQRAVKRVCVSVCVVNVAGTCCILQAYNHRSCDSVLELNCTKFFSHSKHSVACWSCIYFQVCCLHAFFHVREWITSSVVKTKLFRLLFTSVI